ncbi:MAG: DUF2608 domain-containing protein, partial [Chlamydiota bacterium]
MQKVLFFLFFISSYLFGQIIPCDHLEDVLKHAKSNTLIIFDLDNTLICPAQMLGSNEWFEYQVQKNKQNGHSSEMATKKTLQEWLQVITQTSVTTVE